MSMNAHPASSRAANATTHESRTAARVVSRSTRARLPMDSKSAEKRSKVSFVEEERVDMVGSSSSSTVVASFFVSFRFAFDPSVSDPPRVAFDSKVKDTRISAVVSATSDRTTASSALCASRAAEASQAGALLPPSDVLSLTPEPPPPPPPDAPASYP